MNKQRPGPLPVGSLVQGLGQLDRPVARPAAHEGQRRRVRGAARAFTQSRLSTSLDSLYQRMRSLSGRPGDDEDHLRDGGRLVEERPRVVHLDGRGTRGRIWNTAGDQPLPRLRVGGGVDPGDLVVPGRDRATAWPGAATGTDSPGPAPTDTPSRTTIAVGRIRRMRHGSTRRDGRRTTYWRA